MSEDLTENYSMSESDKFGLVLSELERFQKELHLAKCEIKTTIREVALHQNAINDSLIKLRVKFHDIDERLHGIELIEERRNSST